MHDEIVNEDLEHAADEQDDEPAVVAIIDPNV